MNAPTWPPAARVYARDVKVDHERTLRVGILLRHGCRDELLIAMGTGQGSEWREDAAEGLVLPGHVLGKLVVALIDVGDEVP
jgi:hypothetical protein